MKKHLKTLLAALVVLSFFALPPRLFCQKSSCVDCHKELEDKLAAPARSFDGDIHKQFGLSCHNCHGGNPNLEDIELAKDKSFKGVPKKTQIPEFCASCHSNSAYMHNFNPNLRVDQLQLYGTSRHGELLRKGDPNVAVCTDCHGVHGIQSSTFPKSWTFPWNIPQTCGRCHSNAEHMKAYKIPVNQEDEYKQSVHANALFQKKDLSAPVCNDCHGNHGAAPPEVTSIAFVCRQCHGSAGELFSQSPHKKAFDELGTSECEACHGNHKILPPSDEMLAAGKVDVCLQCHEKGSKPYELGSEMKKKLSGLLATFETADDLLKKAEKQGVETSEPRFKLEQASTALVMARNLTHGLSLEEFDAKITEGDKVIAGARKDGEAALKEARFRKTGLIIATFFIFLLAIALILKIRQLAAKSRT